MSRGRRSRVLATLLSLALLSLAPGGVQAGDLTGRPDLRATLDGKPMPAVEVGRHFCDDFSFPEITCFSQTSELEARRVEIEAVTAVDYVTVYETASYGGSYMHVSQDYPVLAWVGWNDKISSFRGRNGETGKFWADWFNSGTSYSFCCNQTVPILGVYDDTWSSVART
jgi:hypothetical protein